MTATKPSTPGHGLRRTVGNTIDAREPNQPLDTHTHPEGTSMKILMLSAIFGQNFSSGLMELTSLKTPSKPDARRNDSNSAT